MIDISDGLSTDLDHICKESGVGAIIHSTALPLAHLGKQPDPVDLEVALHGGEAYELLFTAPATKRVPSLIAGVPVTKFGEIVRAPAMRLQCADGTVLRLEPKGWQHFSE